MLRNTFFKRYWQLNISFEYNSWNYYQIIINKLIVCLTTLLLENIRIPKHNYRNYLILKTVQKNIILFIIFLTYNFKYQYPLLNKTFSDISNKTFYFEVLNLYLKLGRL